MYKNLLIKNPHPLRARGSQSGQEKRRTKVFKNGQKKRVPGYRLSPNYSQKSMRIPAPDWAQKMLHIVKSQIINSFTLFRDAVPVMTPPEEDNTGRITEP